MPRRRRNTEPIASAPPSREIPPQVAAMVLLIVLAFSAIVRLRLLELPLERDEGEYAYAGQLILQGIPPYAMVYNMKFPGTYAAYALIMAIFGQSIAGIRIGLLLVNAATTVLIYFLTRRLFGRGAGLIAAASHALLSLELTIRGPYAHANHFVNLPMVGALLLLVSPSNRPAMLSAGALLAIAVLMKQPAAAFAIFAVVWLLIERRFRDAALVVSGGTIVALATAITLKLAGVFGRFWFWTVQYAREYVTSAAATDAADLLRNSVRSIFYFAPLLWLMAGAGLLILFLAPSARRHATFIGGFTVAAMVATTPGLYFREHYFIVLLPAASMLIAVSVTPGKLLLPQTARVIPIIVFAIAVALSLVRQWDGFFVIDLERITRLLYAENPFPEAVEVAGYIRDHTLPSDRIAILGSEPEIFFYARRKSATGYIYTYPLMEHQRFASRMQREMITEIERARPKYLLMVSVAASWLAKKDSDRTIFEWAQQQVQRGWIIDGVVDITPAGTIYTWGADAQRYQPSTKNLIVLYRRQ